MKVSGKVRKSKSFLIISSCHLGVDSEILSVFQNVAKNYDAQTYHVGPTSLDGDIRKYESLQKKLSSYVLKLPNTTTDRQDEVLQEKIQEVKYQLADLVYEHNDTVDALKEAFPNIKFITNPKTSLLYNSPEHKKSIITDGLELSKYLFISAVPPRGVKATRNPFNKQAVSFLKQCGKNWIVGFPVPSVEPLPKPGLNESYNYFTVGMMTDVKTPHKHNEMYQSDHLPAAVLVVMDQENGEFHACHLHIDYIKNSKANAKAVLHDGLVFTADKVFEVSASDRATYDTDGHAPHQHPGTLGAIRFINEIFQPETYIDGGDSADFESVNRHGAGLPGTTEGLRLIDDIVSLRRFLDAKTETKSIKNKILIDSNHHEWVTNLIMEKPCLKGLCDWDTLAEKYYSDWDIILRKAGDNRIYYFGDYMIRHGDKDGGHKKAIDMSPVGKYACGHFHRYMAYKRSVSLGTSAKLGPAYTGNQINAWQSQFGTCTKFNGVTSLAPKTVLHDKIKAVSRVCFRNKIYEVKHYFIGE